jgi:antitoxin MazE
MEAVMKVFKWGDDLAVELPEVLVDQLGLKEGDELNVVAAEDGVIEGEAGKATPKGARPDGDK